MDIGITKTEPKHNQNSTSSTTAIAMEKTIEGTSAKPESTRMLGPYLLGPNHTPENGIYTGDSRELAKAIPDESVDLILTDPPYNIGFSGYDCYDDRMPFNRYIEMIAQLRRLGPIAIIQYPEEMMRYIVPALRAPDHVSAWCYNAQIPRRFRLVNYYGVIPNYSRIKQPYKNPDDKRVAARIKNGSTGTNLYEWWYDIQLVKNISDEKGEHPCPVPIRLMERLIILCTDPGDIVVDPFCGSGTTLVAAKRTGRQYLGFELSDHYADLARKRVAQTQPPLFVLQPEQVEMVK